MTVNVYIESSIKGPRKKNGVVGFVLQAGDTDVTKTLFGTVQDATANYSNLICLKQALSRILPSTESIIIHTSSGYVNLSVLATKKNQRSCDVATREIKYAAEWQEIANLLGDREVEVKLNQPNEFRSWLQQEVERRAENHGF